MEPQVGARFVCGEDKGVVRYVGPVATAKSQKTVWIGVEWDSQERGTHDGAVEKDGGEIRYFTCPPGKGSFIRPEKVDFGRSFLEALKAKYAPEEKSQDDLSVTVQNSGTSRQFEQPVIFVGREQVYEKQSKLEATTEAVLRGQRISSFNEHGELSAACPKIIDLDLSDNLFTNWSAVAQVASQLSLRKLELSFNKMSSEIDVSVFRGKFENLRTLYMGAVQNAWNHVMRLCSGGCFPVLEELYLGGNKISSFECEKDSLGELFPSLKTFDLCDNELEWCEIWKLSTLPKLERLYLDKNKLTTVSYESDGKDIVPFPQLREIWLKNNQIDNEKTFDALNLFPSLINCIFTLNPIVKSLGPANTRQLAIAKIKKLRKANRSHISALERSDAEKFYVKRCYLSYHNDDKKSNSSETQNEKNDSPSIGKLFARYDELTAIYGEPVTSKSKQSIGSSLSSSLIEITLRSMDPDSITAPPKTKKLSLTMKISNVKMICKRLFKLHPSKQKLFFRESAEFPLPLDDDNETLEYFGVRSGGEILMQVA